MPKTKVVQKNTYMRVLEAKVSEIIFSRNYDTFFQRFLNTYFHNDESFESMEL